MEISYHENDYGHHIIGITHLTFSPESKENVNNLTEKRRNTGYQILGETRIKGVDNIDELVSRLVDQGAELVGEIVQYEDVYRLCYVRGTEGILVGLAEQL